MRSTDRVFKVLANPNRRLLLDRLHERNGQTLSELCENAAMTRQATTQHLQVLEAADLVSTVRRGREKLQYLNAVPLHEIGERWIGKFERPRLRALRNLRRRAEDAVGESPDSTTFVYVTYIRATPEAVWAGLTDPQMSGDYWGHSNVSHWAAGSTWAHVRTDGRGSRTSSAASSRVPRRPCSSRPGRPRTTRRDPVRTSRVTFDLTPHGDIVRLTVIHVDLTDPEDLAAVSHGWPAVLSNLKSFLETGIPLPQAPWDMTPA